MWITDAEALAHRLLREYGLTTAGWRFAWDSKCYRRAGYCRPHLKEIGLAMRVVKINTEAAVREVLLHEIAHAISGVWSHSRGWKIIARSIGASGERHPNKAGVVFPEGEWVVACRNEQCRLAYVLVKKPEHTAGKRCRKCGRGGVVVARRRPAPMPVRTAVVAAATMQPPTGVRCSTRAKLPG